MRPTPPMLRHEHAQAAPRSRRGSALLMAFLMIILLFGIVFQLWFSTNVDLRVADNEVTATRMDLAIESALQEVYDRLKTDGETAEASGGEGGEGGDAGADPTAAAGAAAGGGGEESQATDSHEDPWGKPQRTTINEIDLRVIVQDEDSKLNVLGMLTEDEDMAREHFDRVVRVLDLFREGSTLDLDHSDAVRMAEEVRRHLSERPQSVLPRPEVTSYDEDRPDVALPLGLREFVVLEGFDEGLFRDGRDEHGEVIHSLGSFLTVTTSLTTKGSSSEADGGAGGTGSGTNTDTDGSTTPPQDDGTGGTSGGQQDGGSSGGGGASNSNFGVAVNLNTAPVVVLKSLFDDRDMNPRFWDAVIEYRNLEDEEKRDQQAEEGADEPVLDEYGNEVVPRQVFDSVEELKDVDGYDRLDAEMLNRLAPFVMTESQVFSIYVTAFQRSQREQDPSEQFGVEVASDKLIGGLRWRTVRSLVWRYKQNDEVRVVPLTRWEVLDYIPIEVLDYPLEDR